MSGRFEPNQPVNIWFNRDAADAYMVKGRVVENIDATCRPLTNYWLVELPTGARFGVSGVALEPRNAA